MTVTVTAATAASSSVKLLVSPRTAPIRRPIQMQSAATGKGGRAITVDPALVKEMKKAVGEKSAELIKSDMVVGLGTGSTAAFMIEAIGRKIKSGELKNVQGIPTSFSSTVLARQHGVPIVSLSDVDHIDVAIDGADEVDGDLNLIKGGGAAHTLEKVVGDTAEEFVILVDSTKIVEKLGSTFPVPVEVIPAAASVAMRRLKELGGEPELRNAIRKDGPIITDHGNFVIDVKFEGGVDNPAELERKINDIPGVLANGIFVNMTKLVYVGRVDGDKVVVEELTK